MSLEKPNKRLWLFAGAGATILLLGFLLFGFKHGPSATPAAPIAFRLPAERISLTPPGPPPDLLDDIANATLGFEKILVINLPDRTDRRDGFSLAAAFSGLQVEYINGIRYTAEDVEAMRKILPPTGSNKEPNLDPAGIGSWRAHMNAVRKVVEMNLTSALILEDDVDWDLRLKSQLRDFAVASRMLTEPLVGTQDSYLDPTFPNPVPGQRWQDFAWKEGLTAEPSVSPYGDHWDLLWLGHCGNVFPVEDKEKIPLGRVVMSNDPTVPEPQHIQTGLGGKEILDYPPHTRVVARSRHNICITGYAISQAGARRLLYELTIHKRDGGADMMFGSVCDGAKNRSLATCMSVQPSIFLHHRPAGYKSSFSDISGWGNDINEHAKTKGVRWSTRLNFPLLAVGDTDYIDSYPDGG